MEEMLRFAAEYPLFEDLHWLVYRVYVELNKLGWLEVRPEVVPGAADDRYCISARRPRDSTQTLVIPVQLHEQASLERLLKIHSAIRAGDFGRAVLALVSDDTIILENIQAGLHFEFYDMKKGGGVGKNRGTGESATDTARVKRKKQKTGQQREKQRHQAQAVGLEFGSVEHEKKEQAESPLPAR